MKYNFYISDQCVLRKKKFLCLRLSYIIYIYLLSPLFKHSLTRILYFAPFFRKAFGYSLVILKEAQLIHSIGLAMTNHFRGQKLISLHQRNLKITPYGIAIKGGFKNRISFNINLLLAFWPCVKYNLS